VTTVLLNASRGSKQYHSMNSRIAWSYERCELGETRLSRTADLDPSGIRLRAPRKDAVLREWAGRQRSPAVRTDHLPDARKKPRQIAR